MRILLLATPLFVWQCFSASPPVGMAPRRKRAQTSQPMEDDTRDHTSRSMGSSAFQPAMSAQGDAGASQPSAASGLQQPATAQNASNPEPAASQPSAGSAVQPAVAIHAADALRPSISSPAAAAMVRDVLEFGRIPIKRKQPSTDEQRQENVLAQRLIKHKKHMSEDDARQLDELPTTPKERPTAQDLMTRVREGQDCRPWLHCALAVPTQPCQGAVMAGLLCEPLPPTQFQQAAESWFAKQRHHRRRATRSHNHSFCGALHRKNSRHEACIGQGQTRTRVAKAPSCVSQHR